MPRIVSFPITDQNLKNFTRRVINPKDCVINALQILGIVDAYHADLMRIMVGEQGVMLEQIEKIFNFFAKKSVYRFKEYDSKNPNDVIKIKNIIREIPNGTCLFAGLEKKTTGGRHVFILARYDNGSHVVIDPQQENIYQDIQRYLNIAEYLYLLDKSEKK
jgi:hypothetical protein